MKKLLWIPMVVFVLWAGLLVRSFIIEAFPREIDKNLVSASYGGQISEMERVLDEGANPNAIAFEDWTPLMSAIEGDHIDAVKLLVERGADVNLTSPGGNTSLDWALFWDREEIAQFLIVHGAISGR